MAMEVGVVAGEVEKRISIKLYRSDLGRDLRLLNNGTKRSC